MDKSKGHTIPKGIANLENIFDLKERFKGPKNAKTGSSCPLHETINLGTPESPKNVNLGKTMSKEERNLTSNYSGNTRMSSRGPIGI
jgi:hypothetical protein